MSKSDEKEQIMRKTHTALLASISTGYHVDATLNKQMSAISTVSTGTTDAAAATSTTF